MLIQRVQPYISSDIDKGARWSSDIAKELEVSAFGIACVTEDNKDAPWLLFEAGALSKSVSEGRLTPLLCGIEQSDIQRNPLSQFQMTKFDKAEFRKLTHSINSLLGNDALEISILNSLFDTLWPVLDGGVTNILQQEHGARPAVAPPIDGERMMGAIEELLSNSRSISQLMVRPDKFIPEQYIRNAIQAHVSDRYASENDVRQLAMIMTKARTFLSDVQGQDDDDRALIEQVRQTLAECFYLLRKVDRDAQAYSL